MIEFLLNNPPLLILLIFLLISLFQGKPEKRRQQKPPARSKSANERSAAGKPRPKTMARPIFQELRKQLEELAESGERSLSPPVQKPLEEKSLEKTADFDQPFVQETVEKQEDFPEIENLIVRKPKTKKAGIKTNHALKHKKVVEGIIWSEILGPPRSKRPHRPPFYH